MYGVINWAGDAHSSYACHSAVGHGTRGTISGKSRQQKELVFISNTLEQAVNEFTQTLINYGGGSSSLTLSAHEFREIQDYLIKHPLATGLRMPEQAELVAQVVGAYCKMGDKVVKDMVAYGWIDRGKALHVLPAIMKLNEPAPPQKKDNTKVSRRRTCSASDDMGLLSVIIIR